LDITQTLRFYNVGRAGWAEPGQAIANDAGLEPALISNRFQSRMDSLTFEAGEMVSRASPVSCMDAVNAPIGRGGFRASSSEEACYHPISTPRKTDLI
jgi:hypothetical protein